MHLQSYYFANLNLFFLFAVLLSVPVRLCLSPLLYRPRVLAIFRLLLFKFYWDTKREPLRRKEILLRLDISCTRKNGRPDTVREYRGVFQIYFKERVG